MRNIVVLGAGFGGLRVAKKLAKKFKNHPDLRVVLVDKNSYQTYIPALYEVASAYKGDKLTSSSQEREFEEDLAGSVCLSLRDIAESDGIHLVQEEVVRIDPGVKSVILGSDVAINYEYCVIALGGEVAHYNVQGADECCGSLKTIKDALDIRFAVESLFTKSFQESKELRFVTVGAGLSGFELTTELAKYIEHLRRSAYNYDPEKIHISLVEANNEILAGVPRHFRKFALRRLKQLGIDVITGARIVSMEPHQVTLEDGKKIPASFILWGGGIKGPEIFKQTDTFPLERTGRIIVDKHLRVKGHPDVFAVGDSTYIFDEKKGEPVPATAWAAKMEGDLAAKNIIRSINEKDLLEFKPKYPGFVSSAGGKYGIVHLFGFTFKGFAGWFIKRIIDIRYIISVYPFWKGVRLWLKELDLFTRND